MEAGFFLSTAIIHIEENTVLHEIQSERERNVKMSMITRSDSSQYTELNQSSWALARFLSGGVLTTVDSTREPGKSLTTL